MNWRLRFGGLLLMLFPETFVGWMADALDDPSLRAKLIKIGKHLEAS